MDWKKSLGEELHARVLEFIGKRKMSIAALVRLAVEQFIKG